MGRFCTILFLTAYCFLIPVTEVFSQHVVNSHPLPPGYSLVQTRTRNALEIDPSGNKWIAFASIGLGKYDGTSWQMFDSLSSGLPSDSVTSISFDASGNPWIGTRLGAAHFDGTNWVTYNTSNSGLHSNLVTTILVKNNDVWLGTREGIAKFDGTNWTIFNTSNSGLVNDSIIRLCNGTGNEVWIGTQNGLSNYNAGVWTVFDSSNSILIYDRIYDLTYDTSGRLWIAPFFVGSTPELYFISGNTVHSFMDEYYSESYGMVYGLAPVSVSPTGEVAVFMNAPDAAIMLINGYNYKVQYFLQNSPFVFVGGSFGVNSASYDTQGHLWYIRGFSGANPFLEMETDNYSNPEIFHNIYNSKLLDINNVKTLLFNRGHLFYKDYFDELGYEVPKGSNKFPMLGSALWIGGMDQSDSLHMAAEHYYLDSDDFFPGPISGISIPFDSASCVAFDRMWNVYRWQLEEFKYNFASGAVTNGTYPIPEVILNWPAKGNGLVTDDMAPFVDFDGDGFYDPYFGDYPEIKGDQSVFWIYNDSLAAHARTGGAKMGVEILATAYAFSCPLIADSSSVINTTTFHNYRIRNKSNFDYADVYLGLWCDTELGNPADDFIGCDTLLHTGFVYNGDNDDDGFSNGYGLNPPMQNAVILKGPEADPGDGLDNDLDGSIDEPAERTTLNHFTWYFGDPGYLGWPLTAVEYYNYLQSIWLDSTHMTYGGVGHDPLSTNYSNFLYPGTPYDTGWTELNENNLPDDRRFIIGSGPVSFPSGGEITLDFAYVFTRDSLNPNGLNTSIARNIADVQRIQSWFENDSFPSCLVYNVGIDDFNSLNNKLKIYPNPAQNRLYISSDVELKNELVELMDVAGRIVYASKYNHANGMDISYLRDGFYIVRIIRKSESFTGKFIKN